MTEQPLSLVLILLEPALDNAISQWLLATNGVIPDIVNDISQKWVALPPKPEFNLTNFLRPPSF